MKYQVHIQSLDNPDDCTLLGEFETDDDKEKQSQHMVIGLQIAKLKNDNMHRVRYPDNQFLTCDETSKYFQTNH